MSSLPNMTRLTYGISLAIAIIGFARVSEATECISPTLVLRSSRLAGQVFYGDGTPMSGARVTVMSPGYRILEEIATDERGYFDASSVEPGRGSVRVSALGFASVEVQTHLDRRLPFQQLAVRLGLSMTCDGRVCAVMLASPSRLGRAPACLSRGPSTDDEWASEARRLDRSAAKCTAGNDDGACRQLARIAATGKADRTRAYAARVLTDQRLLADLARTAHDASVRAAAAGKLVDPIVVASLARDDRSAAVRVAALSNPALTDQTLLVSIATETGSPFVRSAAVARLARSDILRRLAVDDRDYVVRAAAVSNPALQDQAAFADIARNNHATTAQDLQLRLAAVMRVTDQRQLAEILKRSTDASVRHTAVINPALTDQSVFADVALHDPAPGVRVVAATKLDDPMLTQRVFAEAAQTPADAWGRWLWGEIAVSRLTDQALLAKIALTDEMVCIRVAAVSRLEDQSLLTRIATMDSSPWLRMTATRMLSDRELLSQIARKDEDWWVRQAAQDRLKELRRRR
jgi:hypothetical protein